MTIARKLLFGYAGYALPAAAALWYRHEGQVLADAGVACSLLAGAASLVLALRFARPATRRWVIALHGALVPGQFVLSVPSNVPLLGMLLSVAVLVAMRPAFPRLRPRARRTALTLHIGLSVGWLGLATAMTVLAVTGLVTGDDGLRHHVYRIMHLFDLVIVIPVVVLAILSGLLVSLFTQWGLTRHWWVLVKFVLAVAIPLVAGVQHVWISDLIARTAADPHAAAGALGGRLVGCFAGYDAALWTATALSVFKPGGATPWGRRARRAPSRGSDSGAAVT